MIQHQHEPSEPTTEAPADQGFAERMLNIQAKSSIVGQELQAKFTIDPEGFKEELDGVVEQVVSQDPEFQEMFSRLMVERSVTVGSKRASALVIELNTIRARIKEIIVSELGLPSEAHLNELQTAQRNVENILESAITHPQTPQEVFVALGIEEPREDGHDIFTFPYEIMPDSVNKKWDTYIATVLRDTQAAEDFRNDVAGVSMGDVTIADAARKFAHDSVTSDVHAILALEKRGMKWDWQDTREKLLARIRDSQLPTDRIALSPAARDFVKAHTDSVTVTEALSSRRSH